MATNTLYFTGKCQWAKVKTPDTKFNPEGVYSIDVFLDKENLKKFNDSKMQLKLRHNDTNDEPYVTFKRADKQMIKGEIVDRGPPQLLDKDSAPLSQDTLIGNGSTVTVKVVTYDGAKGKGHRLEAVRVDDLVEFDKGEQDVPQEGLPF